MSIKLSEILPTPKAALADGVSRELPRDAWFAGHEDSLTYGSSERSVVAAVKEPPSYGQRQRYQPRKAEDFGDGGAFPEIHHAQFPLGMGLERGHGAGGGANNTLALQLDSEGKLRFDEIARVGHDKSKIVHTRLDSTKQKVIDETDESFQRPDDDEVAETTEATRIALEKLTAAKISSSLPVQHAQKQAPAQYIRYTPSQQAGVQSTGSQQRIIRLVEEQKDPMEPPRFQINTKIPRAPPSPPAPVLHSPTRKISAKEQADWKIPPCISNWKNPKGYTVPLDKRLAADGRGLQQVHINENFAKMAEALAIAERKAREAVETRATMERRIAQNKKSDQEKRMRELATKAREERTHAVRKAAADEEEGGEVAEEALEREAIRRDRRDDIRKERNIARQRPDKLQKLLDQKDRDISEKIALGLPDTRKRATGETQFDQRLFGQSGGLDSGGIDDETYAAYDKPWRPNDTIQKSIYRPTKEVDASVYGADLDNLIRQTNRFVPDRGFEGAEREPVPAGGGGGGRGSGPVQFEQAQRGGGGGDEDLFGLDDLLKTNAPSTGEPTSKRSRK